MLSIPVSVTFFHVTDKAGAPEDKFGCFRGDTQYARGAPAKMTVVQIQHAPWDEVEPDIVIRLTHLRHKALGRIARRNKHPGFTYAVTVSRSSRFIRCRKNIEVSDI